MLDICAQWWSVETLYFKCAYTIYWLYARTQYSGNMREHNTVVIGDHIVNTRLLPWRHQACPFREPLSNAWNLFVSSSSSSASSSSLSSPSSSTTLQHYHYQERKLETTGRDNHWKALQQNMSHSFLTLQLYQWLETYLRNGQLWTRHSPAEQEESIHP